MSKNVQVYLGQIEIWLKEPKVIDSFLKNLFDDAGMDILWSEEVLFQSFCLDANSQMDCTFDLCTEVGTLLKKFKPIMEHTQIKVILLFFTIVQKLGTYLLAQVNGMENRQRFI